MNHSSNKTISNFIFNSLIINLFKKMVSLWMKSYYWESVVIMRSIARLGYLALLGLYWKKWFNLWSCFQCHSIKWLGCVCKNIFVQNCWSQATSAKTTPSNQKAANNKKIKQAKVNFNLSAWVSKRSFNKKKTETTSPNFYEKHKPTLAINENNASSINLKQ